MTDATTPDRVRRVTEKLLAEYDANCRATGTGTTLKPRKARQMRLSVKHYAQLVDSRRITLATTDEQAMKMLPVWLCWFLGRQLVLWLVRRLAEEFFLRRSHAGATE